MGTAADLVPGAVLSGFRIEALIGRGGMGVVYRATQLSLDRQVALKLISPELAHEQRFRDRFLREARLAASIDHPHLLPVYEAGEAGGTLFLALRLIQGASLAEVLTRERPLPPERALRITSQLAEALETAHEAGLLHRDVKPQNALLTGAGEREHTYLCDFGLARRLAGSSLTADHAFVGTARYAAPEQIRGEELDERADLYSLACLLYECLTGDPPFTAEDELALCWAHLHEPARSPSTVRPELGESFDAILGRALGKNPDDRYRSASALAEAARAALAGALPATPPPGLPQLKLPSSITSFLGRERELEELLTLLLEADTRLLTLTGPGGTGKTRLALRAAEEAAPAFPDGVYWVGLASLRDASLLDTTFAQALGVAEQPGVAIVDSIVASFAGKRALVVVDNCEHLADGVAGLMRTLVDGCPTLFHLASSRERLRLRGECVYAVPPMAPTDAEALFAARARAVSAGFEPDDHVSAICEAVDGLPLAIELAAARTRALSTQAIRERLGERLGLLTTRDRDVEERQRTLEATIAWSYDLLDPEEQRVLRALSVFAGGCTLVAAEAVAGADLELLESLLDKSLLRHGIDEAGQDRYWMLETIREFAAQRLEDATEVSTFRAAHRKLFTAHASRLVTGPLLAGTEFHLFEADRANYRVVLLDALANADAATALRLAACLAPIWFQVGELADSYALIQRALALEGGDARDRGHASRIAGDLAMALQDFDAAHRFLDQADALWAATGDALLRHEVLVSRSVFALRTGEHDSAIASAQGAVDVARSLGAKDLEMKALGMQIQAMRWAAIDRDKIDAATLKECLALAEELLAWASESALLSEQAFSHNLLATMHLALGNYSDALNHQRASLEREHTMGRRWWVLDIFAIGVIAGRLGHHATAAQLASWARRWIAMEGVTLDPDDAHHQLRLEEEARAALGDDGYAEAVRAGEALTQEEAIELAFGFEAHEPAE